MSRIRTIKPEFFRHEQLFEAEKESGLPLRLAFMALWTVADREGRFKWKPRVLKLDCLPFNELDFEDVLNALCSIELIEKYEYEGEIFGSIVSWHRHQIPGRDEPPSDIPAPNGTKTLYFRPLSQTQRFKVYERDNWTCLYCDRDLYKDRRAACLDHVIPYSCGGTNRECNLATSCKKCNALKSGRSPDQVGLKWPKGLGEAFNKVNGTLTVCPSTVRDRTVVADKERERERERIKKDTDKSVSKESWNSMNGGGQARKTRISEDAHPTEHDIAFAQEHGVCDIAKHWESFVDYHLKHGSVMANWRAAWRTWVRNIQKFKSNGEDRDYGRWRERNPLTAATIDFLGEDYDQPRNIPAAKRLGKS